ncbi:hypothetical protein KQX54_012865 [Cotesia glomerata]|uniref:Uncharacterized protein n=1 Tax=Cotesia glomerata TaxID=32391 RepID=A0AAV7IAC0_COTGL|nr:hypothetical protein KQX54_012865 [Cotesia glomerata]
MESKNPYGSGLRTHAGTVKHAATQDKGIKSESVLLKIPKFDIILGIYVDWMHCVALGVCRQFARLCVEELYGEEELSFNNFNQEILAFIQSSHGVAQQVYDGFCTKVDDIKLLGEPRILDLTREQFLASRRKHISFEHNSQVQHYYRAVINHLLLHSNSYEKCIKRNNRCVKLSNNEILDIDSFIDIAKMTQCYVIGRCFERLKQPFVPGRKLIHMCMVKSKQKCWVFVHSKIVVGMGE